MTEETFYQMIGKRLKNLRKKANLTQEELSGKSGIYRTDISAFESRGERIRSANHIRLLVESTGHTMKDLFDDPEKKTLADRSTSKLRLKVQPV